MRKLRLDDLTVDSFDTLPRHGQGRGSVHAHDTWFGGPCNDCLTDGGDSCQPSYYYHQCQTPACGSQGCPSARSCMPQTCNIDCPDEPDTWTMDIAVC